MRPLGEGGMGQVFLAEREDIGGRVAVKILHQHLAKDAGMATRFLNEARAANQVEHPGITRVLEYGRHTDGSAFIVMEFLEGESLTRRIARGALPLELALRIGRQMALALAAAHARGIVHRDLKPDNVMLIPESEMAGGVRVKVLDFGIAKLLSELQQKDSATKTGTFMGTPMYMAPEQARDTKSATDRADVYALGSMLYEMLSGQPPFAGAEGIGVLSKLLTEDPPPLLGKAPQTPAAVADLVHRLLLRDATQRPAMAEVAKELGQLVGDSLSGALAAGMASAGGGTAAISPTAVKSETPSWRSITDRGAMQSAAQTTVTMAGKVGRFVLRAVLIACAVFVALFFLLLLLGKSRHRSDDKQQAEIAAELEQQHWAEVQQRADRLLLRLESTDIHHAEVQHLKDRAVQEEKAKALLPQIITSAASEQVEATVQLYRQLATDSYYQADAQKAAQPMLNQYFAQHLQRATQARDEGRCSDVQAELANVLSVEPKQPAALAAKDLPCPAPRPRKERADKPKNR